MKRLAALLVMLVPGFLAAYGVKLMRDMLFGKLLEPFGLLWLQFLTGFILFVTGLGFVAGFVLYRDRKRNKVQDRFKNK
ncbi:hypothetical protein AM500_09600 [Bacillus sp. FJAT-18017]|jgi:hypothetical protein|uniref:DUF2627 domain-containing protein n=1 Tax=unclassified Bacillus (in: firmicutes) TaxID=185979 RepID=UPI0005C777E6|nr:MULTISPECIES: DUF2627 domain-containing protein [unclassified Bacillus (in: firmicutes)]ALC90003.1 hypothetical protein AM500_09600 [Bacillus sp. FJAT-18017]